MKLKYILMAGLACASFASCNDYLDVEAPSKYDNDYVFGTETEINRALNGVYAQILESNLYGNQFLTNFCMNSDVDFSTNSTETPTSNGFKRFECTSDASGLKSTWNSAYQGVEYANNFVYQLENSDIYKAGDNSDLYQYMGEAKVIRAMLFNELVDYWGDVPFTFAPTSQKEDMVTPIVSRDSIRAALIDDLRGIAPKMQYAKNLDNTIEHVSKEACWAMIARLALAAGGYSLRADKQNPSSYGTMQRPANYKEYYQIARNYADSVIKSNTHSLTKSYRQVFIDECNFVVDNSDDAIFEIPFAKKTSGNIGYIHGPKASLGNDNTSVAPNVWGSTSGSATVSTFYGYSFDESDLRRDYVVGMWQYTNRGDSICIPSIRTDYTMFNNKWSKLWSNAGNFENTSSGNTGINFPYLRYADVLLMFAEADNELNDGPTEDAKEALKKVRRRAFESADWATKVDAYVDSVSQAGVGERYNSAKKAFLRAVLNERKWEFAGENMRWKDLVRNNLYSEVLYYTFFRYYSVGEDAGGSSQNMDAVAEYDAVDAERYMDLPRDIYYRRIANPKNTSVYPNTALEILEIANPYHQLLTKPKDEAGTATDYQWATGSCFAWWNETYGTPTNQCLYSLYGFIRGSQIGMIYLEDGNGGTTLVSNCDANATADKLPVVRYILPIPNAAIQRSGNVYRNYYGYAN